MKLPAYAKPLLIARRSGVHPASVTVIYGHDWYVAEGVTRLAVKPGEALGLNWSCVAGLPVELISRHVTDAKAHEFYVLSGEIAREAAEVMLTEPDGRRMCASDFAFTCRRWNAATQRVEWPGWWSDEIEKTHGENRQRWNQEAVRYLARSVA